jgi:hypothetical protein
MSHDAANRRCAQYGMYWPESNYHQCTCDQVRSDVKDDISTSVTEELSYLDKLRAALVDSAGLDTIEDPEPLIGDDLLFRHSLVWMIGKPGSMKSFTALDMAGCVGTGESWQGWPVRQGNVLFLVAEGVHGTKKRVRAWEKAMSRTMDGVRFLPVAVQTRNGTQWDAFVELAREVEPALVVLDTQARISVGVEENSNTEMGTYIVKQCDRLRDATGACVILVHHIGKSSDSGRGATAVEGAVDTVIRVSKDEQRVKLECTKNKDGEQWADITLRAIPMGDSVILGPDDGTQTTDSFDALLSKAWVRDWWNTHQRDPVSISVLEKSNVVAASTFHRAKFALLDQGIAVREGKGNATRYRLAIDPTAA